VAVRSLSRARPEGVPTELLTTDAEAVVTDPEVDVAAPSPASGTRTTTRGAGRSAGSGCG